MRLAIPIVVSAALSGCGGDGSPAGPAGASSVRIIMSVPSFGMAISLTVGGETISTSGTHEVRLPAGTHTINGSFTPTGLSGARGVLSRAPQLSLVSCKASSGPGSKKKRLTAMASLNAFASEWRPGYRLNRRRRVARPSIPRPRSIALAPPSGTDV